MAILICKRCGKPIVTKLVHWHRDGNLHYPCHPLTAVDDIYLKEFGYFYTNEQLNDLGWTLEELYRAIEESTLPLRWPEMQPLLPEGCMDPSARPLDLDETFYSVHD